jgi:two-component system, OmpR family, sensor histidine kinase VicK
LKLSSPHKSGGKIISEGTEVFYGINDVMNTVLQFLHQTDGKIDACVDYTRPSLAIDILILKDAFLDAKKRGVKLRYVTEITQDNVFYCKQMIKMVDELRHLDGIKGNFYISETGYLAPATFHEAGKPATQIIFSNVKELIEHQKYVFETLWSKTISAEQRIREIEEGILRHETVIIDNSDEIIKEIRSLTANSNQLDTCLTSGGMLYSHKHFFDLKEKLIDKQKRGEHKGLRYITNIDNQNLELVKLYLDRGIQVKHAKNLPPMSFGVSDKKIAVTIEKMEKGKVVQSLLLSNESQYLKHFSSVFQQLWENGIEAVDRIKEIEEGIEEEFYEVITDNEKANQILVDMIKSVKREALIFLPNDKALMRAERLGIVDSLLKASKNGADVKIICPLSEENAEIQKKILENAPDIRILDGNGSPYGMYITDRERFLRAELKRPEAEKFSDAIGLVVYSNRRTTVDSFKSVFELLWNERILVEELRRTDRMQKEFISVAAHELKTPIQAILGISGILKYYPERTDQLLEVIKRNAIRLQRLSANILDVTRIESQTFKLEKVRFNIHDLIPTIIEDYKERIKDSTNNKVELIYNDNFNNKSTIVVEADRERITQVISNLLDNAIKFTNEGYISLNISTNDDDNEVIISVRDTGIGIDSEVLQRLFSKFVTRSQQGTGLGLFISKNIVEPHGGKIWAEQNVLEGRGTVFSFTLPLASNDGIEEEKGDWVLSNG